MQLQVMLCTLLLPGQSALEHGLNPKLGILLNYAKREPALRKKKGRPTEKRVARLREKEKELKVDAQPLYHIQKVTEIYNKVT